jgi:glycosyltransferase involved in cell wall biosynthesis
MGLSDSVYFLPFVSNVASTLKGLQVIAIPSLWEASPLLPMEAMVSGVPVIGSNCVGLREVLKGTPATIIPARDSFALSEALAMEIKNPTTAKAKEFATEAAARFQVKERAAEIENLMLKFLKK